MHADGLDDMFAASYPKNTEKGAQYLCDEKARSMDQEEADQRRSAPSLGRTADLHNSKIILCRAKTSGGKMTGMMSIPHERV